MIRKALVFWVITLLIPFAAMGQQVFHFAVNQTDMLVADAGVDQTVGTGVPLQLGGNPTATGGTPPYFYLWQPGKGLSDSLAANPMLLTDSTRTYTLRVTDQQGCTSEQHVQITVLTGVYRGVTPTACPCIIVPNPVTGHVMFMNCNQPGASEAQVVVRTLSGTELLRLPIHDGTNAIDLSSTGFSGGILVVTICSTTMHHYKVVVL
jgi:hypothetical protein